MSRNIPYMMDGSAHPRQVLDIYAPADVQGYPVVMMVSGGGWTSGDKDWVAHFADELNPMGIGVVTVDHRIHPDTHPLDQAHDIANALRWVIATIEDYGGDPTQIVLGGHSAGGHLIALAGMSPDYLSDEERDHVIGLMPISAALDAEARFGTDGSPLNFVREGLPPMLLLVAEGDFERLDMMAESMKAKLNDVDVPAIYHVIPNTDHFSIISNAQTFDRIRQWLQVIFAM